MLATHNETLLLLKPNAPQTQPQTQMLETLADAQNVGPPKMPRTRMLQRRWCKRDYPNVDAPYVAKRKHATHLNLACPYEGFPIKASLLRSPY